ncbi:MAG: molybdopterin molybdotransferase MoeA, partial [Caulobacteraceae bacterium]
MKPMDVLQIGAPAGFSGKKRVAAPGEAGEDRIPSPKTDGAALAPRTDYGRRTASFGEAIDIVARLAAPSAAESVDLAAASGRVLASPVIAARTAPGSAVSAMDGYAVRDADLACAPTRLSVVGRIFAGDSPPQWALPRGCCARVFTGAPLPIGADRVVVQEDVEELASAARIERRPTGRRHIRAAGSDFRAGDRLLDPGQVVSPQALIAAAGADVARLVVHQRPRVSIVSTGDELGEPGAERRPGAIPESVSFGVEAMAEQWGAEVVGRRRIGDDRAALERAAK